jgi:hypothetical protein
MVVRLGIEEPEKSEAMSSFVVTRAHLKVACDQKHWALLDKLLAIDASSINDNSLYTDTWGSWWGMLLHCVMENQREGVQVLLAHGADPDLASWGDGIPVTPREEAQGKPQILPLFEQPEPVTYQRRSDPPLPIQTTAEIKAINRQGAIRDATGLVFQIKDT